MLGLAEMRVPAFLSTICKSYLTNRVKFILHYLRDLSYISLLDQQLEIGLYRRSRRSVQLPQGTAIGLPDGYPCILPQLLDADTPLPRRRICGSESKYMSSHLLRPPRSPPHCAPQSCGAADAIAGTYLLAGGAYPFRRPVQCRSCDRCKIPKFAFPHA